MQIQDTLEEAINLIHRDEKDYYWAGQFVDTLVQVSIERSQNQTLGQVHLAMQNINQDLWNVCTLVYRLEWLRNLAIKNQLGFTLWNMSASLDIEHFHVELRSILDYIANILGIIAKKPGQVRSNSFRELYQWLDANPGNIARLGEEQSTLVLSAPWYSELRSIRDSMLHQGAFTLAGFGSPKDGVLFQVYKGPRQLINIDSLMWNENVVDFQLYAGLYFARVIVLLERLGGLLASRIPQQLSIRGVKGVKSNYQGFGILRNWMSKLLDKLLEGNLIANKK